MHLFPGVLVGLAGGEVIRCILLIVGYDSQLAFCAADSVGYRW